MAAEAGSHVVDGLFKGEQEELEAVVKCHANAASHAKEAAQDATEAGRNVRKLIDAAIDFYKEYRTAKDQAAASAIHRA
jgi:hypothetical protein